MFNLDDSTGLHFGILRRGCLDWSYFNGNNYCKAPWTTSEVANWASNNSPGGLAIRFDI